LARSRPCRDVSANLHELADLLTKGAERERESLRRTIERIVKDAQVIPLDSRVVDIAREIEVGYDLSAQDSSYLPR
jgi:predicted nucleic acid-binding protein